MIKFSDGLVLSSPKWPTKESFYGLFDFGIKISNKPSCFLNSPINQTNPRLLRKAYIGFFATFFSSNGTSVCWSVHRSFVRNPSASIAKVMWRYQPTQLRTSYWSNPTSPLAISKHWWVDPRNFPVSPSQNGAGASQLTPLPLGKPADHSCSPMRKQARLFLKHPFHKHRCSCFTLIKRLVFSHRPRNQRFVEVPTHRI